jgi:hypothetical protein
MSIPQAKFEIRKEDEIRKNDDKIKTSFSLDVERWALNVERFFSLRLEGWLSPV